MQAEAWFDVGHAGCTLRPKGLVRKERAALDAHNNCMSAAGSHLPWLIGCDGGRNGGMQSVYEPATARR